MNHEKQLEDLREIKQWLSSKRYSPHLKDILLIFLHYLIHTCERLPCKILWHGINFTPESKRPLTSTSLSSSMPNDSMIMASGILCTSKDWPKYSLSPSVQRSQHEYCLTPWNHHKGKKYLDSLRP